jgi:LysM repeat protein
VPILSFRPPFVPGHQFGDYFIAPQIIVYLLWFFSIGFIAVGPWILTKKLLTRTEKYIKTIVRALSIFSGLIIISILALVVSFILAIKSQKEPQFFPFNESSGEYVISQDSSTDKSPFIVMYKGPNNGFITKNSEGYISVIVGSTNYDLSKYLGKQVFITKGDFVSSSKQCVAGLCKDISGPYVVVNIDEMQEIVETKLRDKIVEYQVAEGDTLNIISEKFSISPNTIKWANNLSNETVKTGQRLIILPVSGVLHLVTKGETLESIAAKYKTTVQKIINYPYNEFLDNKYSLKVGQTLIVPGGVKN